LETQNKTFKPGAKTHQEEGVEGKEVGRQKRLGTICLYTHIKRNNATRRRAAGL
jgi:hypothetical protein